jgi:multicomponent Na+:H+ antiporter subunit D
MVAIFAFLAVLVPFLGCGVTIVCKRRRWVTLVCAGISFGSLLRLTFETPLEFSLYMWMNPVKIKVLIDGFSLVFALLISFLFLLCAVYSSYIKSKRYYSLLLLDLGFLLSLVFMNHIMVFYVFLEMSTITTYFLVIHNETEEAMKAGFKYILMNVGGALLILMAIFLGPSPLASFLFVAGCLVKAGSFPVHVWLADAHPAAPAPVSALLSGALVKVGVYSLFRFTPYFGAQSSVVIYVALTSMVVGVFLALIQTDIKRILAYCTVSQVGFVLLGMGLQSNLGISGGYLHLINHGVFKALLFLCMGCVIYATGKRNILKLGGLKSVMPVTAAACLIGCLSISGVPPFNGFVSKSLISHALDSDIMRALFLLTCAGTVASFTKLFRHIFLGELKTETKEIPLSMKVPLLVLSGLCVILGFFPGLVFTITGVTPEYTVWNRSCLLDVLLAGGLGIAFYVISLETKIIFRTPQLSVVDKFFYMGGKIVEYLSELLNKWLTLDINFYAIVMIMVLVLLFLVWNL